VSLSVPSVKQAGREFGFVDDLSRRSSRGNGGFFVGSIGPSRLGRKNRRKEKGKKGIEAESSKNKTYAR